MKHKKIKIALALSMVAVLMTFVSLSVYAYFSSRVYVYTDDGDKEVARVGMNLQLLFGMLDADAVAEDQDLKIPSYTISTDGFVQYNDGTTAGQLTTYDPSAAWGTAQNPYIISETRHLQNLAALHRIGYFDLLYISDNFASNSYVTGNASIPYFLVCNTDGTPVTINGTKSSGGNVVIDPIGSAEHPFIGVIGGAFVTSTVDSNGTTTLTTSVDGKNSTVSAIHNFTVTTNTNQTDVGLFGYVGYMGDESTATANGGYNEFAGVFSSIQDLLISDVSVVVNRPSVSERLSTLFAPLWERLFGNEDGEADEGNVLHRYSYVGNSSTEPLPHETHHIGIFAGHVSYALIDNISIYYSNENTYAIDLLGASDADNYLSDTGILGMLYNMNCTIKNVSGGNCVVQVGTGTSSEEISTGIAGTGTGGGIYSGNGRGYVTAAEIFTTFNKVDVQNANNELLWRYRTTEGGDWVTNAIMIFGTNVGTDKKPEYKYTLADGQTEVTINSDGNPVVGDKEWEVPFFVRMNVTRTDGETEFSDRTYLGDPVYDPELMGNTYNGEVIWKYSAGGDGIWHYGIRVYKETTQGENGEEVTYKLATGANGKVVTLTDDVTIKYTDTTWENFFITDMVTGKHTTYDRSKQEYLDVTEFERKPLPLIDAYGLNQKTGTMEALCIPWQASPNSTKHYYFYDGVFTFGLSSPNDTVRDTWKNEEISKLYLGANNAESWQINAQRGNRAAVALLKPITSNKDLDEAIKAGKQFYITAQPVSGSAYVMSLNAGVDISDSKVYPNSIPSTNVLLADSDLKNTLKQYYGDGTYTRVPTVPILDRETGKTQYVTMFKGINADGTYDYYDLSDLKAVSSETQKTFWDDYVILDIGRTSSGVTLDALTNYNNVLPQNVKDGEDTKYYYYNSNTGTFVGTSSGILEVPQYNGFDSYIYYTVSYKAPNDKWYGREHIPGEGMYGRGEWVDHVMDGSVSENELPDASYTKGAESGTIYDRMRDYTYTFYYQPAGGGDPVPLGSTTLRVTGVFSTNRVSNNSNNLTDAQYQQSYGVVQMPNFSYEMVYYGHSDGTETYERNLNVQGFTNRYSNNYAQRTRTCFEVIAALPDTVTITPATEDGEQITKHGQLMFNLSATVNGTTYEGTIPMVNATANRFHGENDTLEYNSTSAIMSDGYVAVDSDNPNRTYNYYYYDVAENKYCQVSGTNSNDVKVTQVTTVPDNALLLKRYPAYTFRNNANDKASQSYLQFLHQYLRDNYWYGKNGDEYLLWAGTQTQYEQLKTYMAKGNQATESVLIFGQNANEPNSCYIQYTYTAENIPNMKDQQSGQATNIDYNLTRYVSYTHDEETGLTFGLSETASPLYIYVVEGMLDTSAGVNTFIPTSSTTPLDGDQYVLWPQTTLTQTGYNTNVITFDEEKKTYQVTVTPTLDGDLNAKKLVTADPTYSIIPLADLHWGTSSGYVLGAENKHGLDSKFQMADQGYFGKINLNADGTFNQLAESNIMVAPVGSNGATSAVPKGCVAFTVNATGTQTIRIIVAVPTTDFYLNEGDFFKSEMDLANDYYVGVWKMAQIQEGTSSSITFNKSAAVEKFELPRSYSFSFQDTPSSIEPKIENGVEVGMRHYTLVTYQGQTYRTYLNGDTFLVAYEFTIQGNAENAGTYIIGSAHGADTVSNSVTDIPMEIVHFSVSGTASPGRDGVNGNQLGTIDFVYDDSVTAANGSVVSNGENIITVDRANKTGGPSNGGTEDYANYYASKCLLFSNNTVLDETETGSTDDGFIEISYAQLKIRRYLVGTRTNAQTTIVYSIASEVSGDAFVVKQYEYAVTTDAVVKKSDSTG